MTSEKWNGGKMEWWKDGMKEWWKDGIIGRDV